MALGYSLPCYGLLRTNPQELVNSSLGFSAQHSMFLYTQPLANISCSQGNLTGLYFCYKAIRSQSINEPIFTIALLQDTGSEYIISFIYREMEDRAFCLSQSDEARCCKWVAMQRTLIVNSSSVLAVVTADASVGNGRLYETDEFSSGVVYSPPPELPVAGGSSVVGLDRRETGRIPVLFIRLALEAAVYCLLIVHALYMFRPLLFNFLL